MLLVPENGIHVAGAIGITVTLILTVVRTYLRLGYKKQKIDGDDIFICLATAIYVAMAAMYIGICPQMYKVWSFQYGLIPFYPDLMKDGLALIKIFFPATIMLWLVLWGVKFSLLFYFRRFMARLPIYLRWWWAVTIFSILMLIGCIVSHLVSCSSMHSWFTPGTCSTPRDVHAQLFSLYFSCVVDVVTDLMIMALPLGLLWNLQVTTRQKFGIGGVFSVGVMCIVFALVRVVQISAHAENRTPDSSWLALWAIIEGAVAVVTGCLPVFGMLLRPGRAAKTGNGYTGGSGGTKQKKTSNNTAQSEGTTNGNGIRIFRKQSIDIQLRSIDPNREGFEPMDSQENLAPGMSTIIDHQRREKV